MLTASDTALARGERWVAPSVVARKLRYSTRTVQRMCESGAIPAHCDPSERWRIPASWLDAELRKLGAVVRRARNRDDRDDRDKRMESQSGTMTSR